MADSTSLMYGAISVFAVMMIVLAMRMARESEVKGLKSEVKSLSGEVTELRQYKLRAEKSLQEEQKQKQELAKERDSVVGEVEDSLRRIYALTNQLREMQEQARSRDAELKESRSEVNDLTAQLAEVRSAKLRVEQSLNEELFKKNALLHEKFPGIKELEENFNGKLHQLQAQLQQKQELLTSRDNELTALRSETNALATRLTDMTAAKERAEKALRDELAKETEVVQTKDSVIKQLEENFNGKLHQLQAQLQQKQELLTSRDNELTALRSETNALTTRLTDMTATKERAEKALRDELAKETEVVQTKDSVIKQLEENLNSKLNHLEAQLQQKQQILINRDNELATLRSEMNTLTSRLSELETINEQAEKSLQEEMEKNSEVVEAKDSLIKELEDELNTQLLAMETQLSEKLELLKSRDNELASLRSEINILTKRFGELETAKDQVEQSLRDEIKRKIAQTHDSAVKQLEESFHGKLHSLEAQLGEKQALVDARDGELLGLRSEMNDLMNRLTELESAKELAENALLDELEKNDKIAKTKDSALKQLEESLTGQLHALEARLGEKQQLIEARDGELTTLRSEMNALADRLAEMTAAKERVESSLQEELSKKPDGHQDGDAAVKELEERFNGKLDALESDLNQRQELLNAREQELLALRLEMKILTARLAEMGRAKERAENSLREEIKKKISQSDESAVEVLEQDFEDKLRALENQLNERQELLKARDRQIERLASELREKKLLFAAEETQIWQSIGRRNMWKRRLAKLGIPMKSN